ncbi:hypothetical protein [Flavonifractor plautii]|uniref:hypothetical protein n=1 Tax=Flavonifractor plautii TaxID=292800 RepID=UPI0019596817|nr:hypothetical protein [Flavonifractor plautii]MBM6664557.1 hypothetical protein [Flavonifractor plautii]
MKKCVSRMISILLGLTLILNCNGFAVSQDEDSTVPGSSTIRNTYQSDSGTFRSSETFELLGATVEYSYHITSNPNAESAKNVVMDITISTKNNTYDTTVSGTILSGILDVGQYEYVSGPLRGTISIDGILYNVIVGFQWYSGSNEIQADCTLQNVSNTQDEIIFSFGNANISETVYNSIERFNSNKEDVLAYNDTTNEDASSLSSSGEYTMLGYRTKPQADGSAGGVTLVVHVKESDARIMCTALPHLSEFAAKHDIPQSATSGVYSLEAKMIENPAGDGIFDGIDNVPLQSESSYNAEATADLVRSLLDIALDCPWFGLTGTIIDAVEEIIGESSASTTVENFSNRVSISTDFGGYGIRDTNIDKTGIGIIAHMDAKLSGMTNPVGQFTAYASACYSVYSPAWGSGFPITTYHDSEEAFFSCSVSLFAK